MSLSQQNERKSRSSTFKSYKKLALTMQGGNKKLYQEAAGGDEGIRTIGWSSWVLSVPVTVKYNEDQEYRRKVTLQ